MQNRHYRPPAVISWPGLERLSNPLYHAAKIRTHSAVELLTVEDFLLAYLVDPEQVLGQLQSQCLFASFRPAEDRSIDFEPSRSEFSLSRLSEIRLEDSWKRRTVIREDEATFHSDTLIFEESCEEGTAGGLRCFLEGTASHDCFTLEPIQFVQPPPKVLSSSGTPHLTSCSLSALPELVNEFDQSPLARKLLICERRLAKVVELRYGLVCVGHLLALRLEFSSQDAQSRASAKPGVQDFAGLLYSLSLSVLMQRQATSISCGAEHCVAITNGGEVLTWGNGQAGCLGHGDRTSRLIPTTVDGLRSVHASAVECGAYHSAIVTLDGGMWTWGRGDAGQLGLASARLERDSLGHFSSSPAPVTFFTKRGIKIKVVACGEAHTLVLDRSGVVYACGWNEDGQTGQFPKSQATKCSLCVVFNTEPAIKVSAGALHSCLLTDSGRLYVWGNGAQGQLGLGNKVLSTHIPTRVGVLEGQSLLDVVCGPSSVLCLTERFRAYGWGKGVAGRCEEFSRGSEVACFQPRLLGEVDPVYRVVASCREGLGAVNPALTEKFVLEDSADL